MLLSNAHSGGPRMGTSWELRKSPVISNRHSVLSRAHMKHMGWFWCVWMAGSVHLIKQFPRQCLICPHNHTQPLVTDKKMEVCSFIH